jgi:hypothetical protein
MIDVNLKNIEFVGQKLRTASTPYYYLIADGQVPGHYIKHAFGYNASVGTSVEDVCETSSVINLPATAVAMEVIGGANDVIGGTGINKVRIAGLDGNFVKQTEVVTMNGAAAVALTKTFIRVNSFVSVLTGTLNGAHANVLLRGSGAGVTYSQISLGYNSSAQCLFTIPANYKGFLLGWSGSVAAKDARVILRMKRDRYSGSLTTVFHTYDIMVGTSGGIQKAFQLPITLPPKCDVKISAQALLAGAEAAANFELFYEEL